MVGEGQRSLGKIFFLPLLNQKVFRHFVLGRVGGVKANVITGLCLHSLSESSRLHERGLGWVAQDS
jgi:hypothetical protein